MVSKGGSMVYHFFPLILSSVPANIARSICDITYKSIVLKTLIETQGLTLKVVLLPGTNENGFREKGLSNFTCPMSLRNYTFECNQVLEYNNNLI